MSSINSVPDPEKDVVGSICFIITLLENIMEKYNVPLNTAGSILHDFLTLIIHQNERKLNNG